MENNIMRKYTYKQVPLEHQHPIVHLEHVPGMDMVRAEQFDIRCPEDIVIATVYSEDQAKSLLSHLNQE